MPLTSILRADGSLVRRCRGCDCTDESPCCLPGGLPCAWISDDQCSACFQVASIEQGEQSFFTAWRDQVDVREFAAFQACFWAGAATVFELIRSGGDEAAAVRRVGAELRERAEGD